MKELLPSIALAAVLLGLGACSSPQPKPQPGTINVRTGLFGPNISIGGADGDDSTPVSVRID